jgi:hypothetical protein
MEPFYPLHVCEDCFLVQLQEFVSPKDIFSEYAYFSSLDSWLRHAEEYAHRMVARFGLNTQSHVVEIEQRWLSPSILCLGILV